MPLPLTYSWRNVMARKRSTGVVVLGVAASVLVFVVMAATASGIARVAVSTGDARNLLVMSKGAPSAEASSLSRESANIVRYHPEVARDRRGEPLASAELLLQRPIPRKGEPLGSMEGARYVPIRGVTPDAFEVHSGVRLLAGRFPAHPGEVLIGALLPSKLAGVGIGDELAFGRQLHRVVGVFAAAGQIFEGEVWAELDDLMSENKVSEVSLLVVRLAEPRRLASVEKALEDSKTVSVDAQAEPKYYEDVARSAVGFRFLGNLIGTIMGLGAVFAGANTMYAAMSKRVREMGTLRALGFGAWSVAIGLLIESTLVGILGGALGIAASFAFDGYGMDIFDLSFRLDVTRTAVIGGAALALASGVLGGLLPARAAARLEIVDALRHV